MSDRSMKSSLVLPAGVRLANLDEIPGPDARREFEWSRIQRADIRSGYVISESDNTRFPYYAEANIDAPKIWIVFRELCLALLQGRSTLVMSEIEEDPAPVCAGDVSRVLERLEPHNYHLAHDGYLQFGLVHQSNDQVSEVFVAPTKHFKVWFDDVAAFRAVMRQHGVPEAEVLQFLDEYPRVTIQLAPDRAPFRSVDDLVRVLRTECEGM